jgi:membrane fusion protein (multidrug efflux system)
MKRWLIMIGCVVALVVVIGGIWGFNLYRTISAMRAVQPKETVTAMKVAAQQWRQQLSAVGSLHAVRGADLSAEVAGVVTAIHFESGQDIKAGKLLLELRADDDVAKLEALRAAATLADITYRRTESELKARAVSQAQLDQAAANLKSARAQVAEQQAMVNKKRLHAPFSGHLGIRAVDPGQYVGAGDKIVTLQALDPIHVDFYLPQQNLAVLKVGETVTARTDTYPGLNFSGRIAAINPKVDTDTRNVMVRATVKNAEHKLLPGMFVNVSIDVGAPQPYLTLPSTAITYNPYGATVFVLTADTKAKTDADKKAQQQTGGAANLVAKQVFVGLGPTRGDQVAILKGLRAGDQVVTSGQLKLKNGTAVVVNNKVLPSNDPNPKPVEE